MESFESDLGFLIGKWTLGIWHVKDDRSKKSIKAKVEDNELKKIMKSI